MKKLLFLSLLLLSAAPVWAADVPKAEDLSLREQVGQTIMPRVLIGQQKPFKKAVMNGEVTGFFIKAKEGLLVQPNITAKARTKSRFCWLLITKAGRLPRRCI